MKKICFCLVLATGILAAPVLSFAQSTDPVTRAEVRADLVRVERAGYDPQGEDANYPADIQAAEAKIAAQKSQQQASYGVGGVALTGASSSGTKTHTAMYSTCVGPVSFCNLYFGS